jgi:hypothetical protein
MPKEAALSGSHLDWDRGLCKQGCEEWIPWYEDKKGETVFGCRIGEIPEKVNGQWVCRQRKATKTRSGNWQ